MDESLFDANGCINLEQFKKWNQLIAGNGVICDQKGGCAVGELEATPSNSTVTVATGAAVVDGIPYWSEGATTHDLSPLPTAGFCGFCIVLEANHALNNGAGSVVQKVLKSGSSLLPLLTQNSGGVYRTAIV